MVKHTGFAMQQSSQYLKTWKFLLQCVSPKKIWDLHISEEKTHIFIAY